MMQLLSIDTTCLGSRNDLSCDWEPKPDTRTWDIHPSPFYFTVLPRDLPNTNPIITSDVPLFIDFKSDIKVEKMKMNLEEKIEYILDKAIKSYIDYGTISSTQIKSSILNLLNYIGIDKFQNIPDLILQERIEKAVSIELMNNLFSDLSSLEIDEIKRFSRSEGFFR